MIFGRKKKDEPSDVAPRIGPLGLCIGGSFSADLLQVRMDADVWQFEAGSEHEDHVVVARGEADMGEGCTLERYYTEDNWVLQVLVDRDADEPREITVYQPFDTIHVQSEAGWSEFTGDKGWMRQPVYEIDDGTQYKRIWFADDPGNVELTEFPETVYRGRPERKEHEKHHACMLYGRPVPAGSEHYEYLLVSKETVDSGAVVDMKVGIDITESQLTIF